MNEFWDIVNKWEPLGQGLFFLAAIWIVCQCIYYSSKYMAVWFRGWPDRDVFEED